MCDVSSFQAWFFTKNETPRGHVFLLQSVVGTGCTLVDLMLTLLSTNTPWKINREPENDGLENDFPFQLGDFQVPGVYNNLVWFHFSILANMQEVSLSRKIYGSYG